MNEIAIISGKGGTGKTTLALSIIPYFKDIVIADCDVDAPDLKVLLNDIVTSSKDFIGFQRPMIDYDTCTTCGLCYEMCKFDAITKDISIKSNACEGCKVCEYVCPTDAITMHDYTIGKVFERTTRYGPMIDARLIPGEESSGKLVTEVRTKALQKAKELNKKTIIIDGSPGIACNVISTVTGVSQVLIVTEPTVSGLHDLKKVVQLIKIFNVKAMVIINKYNLSLKQTRQIETYCLTEQLEIALKIPFDKTIVEAISRLEIPSQANIDFFKGAEWNQFIHSITT